MGVVKVSSQNKLSGSISSSHQVWIFAAALSLCVMVLYSLTLSRQYSGDDIQKAIIVENGFPGTHIWHPVNLEREAVPFQEPPVNPRYLLEVTTARFLVKLFRNFRWSDRALLPMQITHLFFGLVGVIGFYFGALRLTRPSMAFALSIGLASSYGWWYYSTHPDFVLAGSAFLTVALAFLINLLLAVEKRPILILSTGLGVSAALSILFFLTSALFVPVIIFAVLYRFWHDYHNPQAGKISVSVFSLTLLLTMALLSGWIFLGTDAGQQSVIELARSAIYYDGSSSKWFSINLGDIPRTFLGIGKSFVQYPPLGSQTPGEYFSSSSWAEVLLMLAWFAILGVIFVMPFGLIAWQWKSLGLYRTIALVLITWIAIQILFGIIWVPSEVKWWIIILPPWFMLIALSSALYLDSDIKYSLGLLGLILFFLCGLVINLSAVFWPQTQEHLQGNRQAARMMAAMSSPNDLFISASATDMDFYLPYYENRRVISYPLTLIMHGGNDKFVVDEIRALVQDYGVNSGSVYLFDCSSEEAANLLESIGKAPESRKKLNLSGRWSSFDTICRISTH